jgi:hypothetical protein
LLEALKDYGAEIAYDRKRETFYFIHPFIFNVSIDARPLNKEELKNKNGGFTFRPDFDTGTP